MDVQTAPTHVTIIPTEKHRLARKPFAGVGQPSVSDALFGALSGSSGSILIDASVGGAVGFFLAPKSKKLGYVALGAASTGLAGVLGLVGFLGYVYLAK